MLSGRKSRATLTGDILEGSLAKCYWQRGILLPLLCCLVVDKVIEGLNCYVQTHALLLAFSALGITHVFDESDTCYSASLKYVEVSKTVMHAVAHVIPT